MRRKDAQVDGFGGDVLGVAGLGIRLGNNLVANPCKVVVALVGLVQELAPLFGLVFLVGRGVVLGYLCTGYINTVGMRCTEFLRDAINGLARWTINQL